jgi:predicted small lipoprotein YifL
MTRRVRVAVTCVLLAAGAAGCGQQGPLTLPESARPIERIEQPTPNPDQNDNARQDPDER